MIAPSGAASVQGDAARFSALARRILDELCSSSSPMELDGRRVAFVGGGRTLRTAFPVAEAVSGAIGGIACALDAIAARRGAGAGSLTVDTRRATALLASPLLQFPLFGDELANANDELNSLTGFFKTQDGRWIFMHGGFDKNTQTLKRVLGLSQVERFSSRHFARSQRQISALTGGWQGLDLEDAVAQAGGIAALARTRGEWLEHPQGQALAAAPVVGIERITDGAPSRLPARNGDLPLAGLRVLDLTRVVAGPFGSRVLAEFGADVLSVLSPNQPSIKWFHVDSSYGKRGALLDLNQADDRAAFFELVKSADVVVQSYRSGCLEKFGITPHQLAKLKPDTIFVSINCYGHDGSWHRRGGWEQLAQTVSGIAYEHGKESGRPELVLPIMPTDMLTGHFAAFGALLALLRRHHEGGSFHVTVSLTRSAMWLYEWLERLDPPAAAIRDPLSVARARQQLLAPASLLQCAAKAFLSREDAKVDALGWRQRTRYQAFKRLVAWLGIPGSEFDALFIDSETSYGSMRHLRSPILLNGVDAVWQRLPAPPARANAAWI